MKTIALLSDFGLNNWYVAEIKSVIQSIAPQITIIDITHLIPSGDIYSATFMIRACKDTFAMPTVFCVLVDPGTHAQKPGIVIDTGDHMFIGPDNGVLSWVTETKLQFPVHTIQNRSLFRMADQTSPFRGRDQFAPIAARLACGLSAQEVGPISKQWEQTQFPVPSQTTAGVAGQVIYTDIFGNIFTNFSNSLINKRQLTLRLSGVDSIIPLYPSYSDAPPGQLFGYAGSTGLIEIGIAGGDAARTYAVTTYQAVYLSYNVST